MALLRKTLGYFPKSQNVPWTFVWVGGGETVLLSQWTSVESCCAGSQETAHSLALPCQRYRQRFTILGVRACGGFVLCPLSWAGTEFPRIPFLYGSSWGWPQENFVQDLETWSEVAASTLWRTPGMVAYLLTLTCWLTLVVQDSTQACSPPAPAESPPSAALRVLG